VTLSAVQKITPGARQPRRFRRKRSRERSRNISFDRGFVCDTFCDTPQSPLVRFRRLRRSAGFREVHIYQAFQQWGHVAEWLRNGLQNRVHQFNSGRGLHPIPLISRNYLFSVCSVRSDCYLIATICLSVSLFHGRFQSGFHHRGGVLLHPGKDARVKVQCDSDFAMPQPFAGDLRMNAIGEQMGCVSMAQIMKAEMSKPRLADRANAERCRSVALRSRQRAR
jgi:hypothetical protein